MNKIELTTPREVEAELISTVLTWIAGQVKTKNVSAEIFPQYLELTLSILARHNLIGAEQFQYLRNMKHQSQFTDLNSLSNRDIVTAIADLRTFEDTLSFLRGLDSSAAHTERFQLLEQAIQIKTSILLSLIDSNLAKATNQVS